MTSTAHVASSDLQPLSEQDQAVALWTFVHLKIPRFTTEIALDVVKGLAPQLDEEPKAVAKRLRKALMGQGVAIKHTAALEAASRLLGHSSWHVANRTDSHFQLKLTSFAMPVREEEFSGWREVTPRLCACCDAWLEQQGSKQVFEVSFAPGYMALNVQVPNEGDAGNKSTQPWPLLTVSPIGPSKDWLTKSPSAIETLRRHLEEPGKAILDGIAVFQFCAADKTRGLIPDRHTEQFDDICNAELVLMQEDNELNPASGFEIARGDELACWSQLELTLRDKGDLFSTDVTIEDGAWIVGDARFVWQLAILLPKEVIPGLRIRILNQEDATALWRRYKLARRLYPNGLTHRQVTKKLDYLGTLSETYRVNLHNLLLELSKAGLTWESYCAEIGETIAMEPNLSVGFVLALIERLKLKDPNTILARPNRAELARIDDDSLLRTLMPRVDHVNYRVRYGLKPELKEVVREAIEELGTTIQVQQLTAAGAFTSNIDPLPYLVYANDAEEFRAKLADQGLVAYAGVIPRIFSTEAIPNLPPNTPPYALGNSLYLDIDFAMGDSQ
ncbi:MAG: glyoxalase superfamily protein [Sterolibacterium sp.]